MAEPSTLASQRPPLGRGPLHHWHAARGARFVEQGGWQVPAAYDTVEKEVAAARAGPAVADLSAFPKISLRGSAVPDLAQAVAPESPALRPLAVARLMLGGPALACRLTADHLLLMAGTLNSGFRENVKPLVAGRAVLETDVTSTLASFGLVGTAQSDVLRCLTPLDVSAAALPPGTCAETNVAGVHALIVRPPSQEVPLLLVSVTWDVAEYVWQRLWEAGRGQDLSPLGLEAWRLPQGP